MAVEFVEKADRSSLENNSTKEIAEARSSAYATEKIGSDMSTEDCARSNAATDRIDSLATLASTQRRTSSAGPLRKCPSINATLQLSAAETSISACPACSGLGLTPSLIAAIFLSDCWSNASATKTAGALLSSRMICKRGPTAAKNPSASRIPYGSRSPCISGRDAIAPITSEWEDTTAFSCVQKLFASLRL